MEVKRKCVEMKRVCFQWWFVYVPFNVGLVLQVFIELGDGFDLGEVGERHSLLSGRMVDEEGEA